MADPELRLELGSHSCTRRQMARSALSCSRRRRLLAGATARGGPLDRELPCLALTHTADALSCSQYWDRSEKIAFMDTHGIDVTVIAWLDQRGHKHD